MIPFQAIYGRTLPTIQQYFPGETKVAVAQELETRDQLLGQLKYNLTRA